MVKRRKNENNEPKKSVIKKKTHKVVQCGGRITTSQELVNRLSNISDFRGVFSRTSLPKKVKKVESGIVNLDHQSGPGTHWIAYKKRGNIVYFFDSFGDLKPPPELIKYFGQGAKIYLNKNQYQNFGETNCGDLCVKFKKKKYDCKLKRK